MNLKRNRRHTDRRSEWGAAQGIAFKIGAGLATIECLAPHVFILDMDDTGPPIYRLAGREIQSVMGSNPKGRGFYGYWDSEARAALEPYFDRSAETRLAFRLFSIVPGTETKAMEFETMLIPVTASGGGKRCFIGICLALGDRPARSGNCGHVQHLQHIAFVRNEITGGNRDG